MRPSPPTLDTARLHLRPWAVDDLDELHRLWVDPAVRRYLWDDEVVSRERAQDALADGIASFATVGYGGWLVRLRAPDSTVGFCGLRSIAGDVELLYGLAPSAWGYGFATEAAAAVLQFGFARCGLDRIVASTDDENLSSVRVLERLGMRRYATRDGVRGPVLCYALARTSAAVPP